jgi:hypothetical protein
MLSRVQCFLAFVLLLVSLGSCKEEVYNGDELINYPDLEKLVRDNWDRDLTTQYQKVVFSPSSRDSIMLNKNEMPWSTIDSLLAMANLQKKELDHHYRIDIMNDSVSETITLYYESLAEDDFTRNMSIVSNDDNSIRNVYFETKSAEKGIQKVLFIPKTLLQIQQRQKKAIQAETYYFVD